MTENIDRMKPVIAGAVGNPARSCAQSCEGNAYRIEIRRLTAERDALSAKLAELEGQEQAGTIPAARRYLVVSGGDRSFVTHKLETARKDAERLARNTKLRVDVFALIPVGSARIAPSVQWKAAQ